MTEVNTIKITKINEIYIRIDSDKGILQELYDYFSFYAKNYKFLPLYKNTNWDGKIHVFNSKNRLIYAGLLDEVITFANERDYKIVMDYVEFAEKEFSRNEAIDFIKKIVSEVKIPDFQVRDYQIDSFVTMIRNKRMLLLSPTSSGKSFLIYLLHRYYNSPTLIIVDTAQAARQMASDISEYGYDPEKIHTIYSGKDKTKLAPIVISTWQSAIKLNSDYLNQFMVFIGDECHHFQAKSFMALMENVNEAKYRYGFTGTIDEESECNVMILTGLFGKIERFVTTSELMEQGFVTPIKIKSIILQYNDETKKLIRTKIKNRVKIDYINELNFLETYPKRNKFIKNLVCSLAVKNENTMIFFQHKEHGELLYSSIREEFEKLNLPVNNVHISHDGIKARDRDNIKTAFENGVGQIGIVSYGTFQTSISIKNIHNLIFASPSKSLIRILQSIGRGLRLHHSKKFVTLYDISDNMILSNIVNHTIKHFKIRMKIYAKENFKVKIYNINLE